MWLLDWKRFTEWGGGSPKQKTAPDQLESGVYR